MILVVLALSLSGLARFYTDFLWFDSVGLGDVWRELLLARLVPLAVFTAAFFAMMFASLTIADRLAPRAPSMGPEDEFFERYQQIMGRFAGRIRAAVALVLALLAGASASGQWNEWILFRNSVDFGIKDPQFGKDIGFYVFELPFISFVIDWFFAALLIILIATVVAHYFNGGIRLQSPHQRVTPQVKAHLSVILGLMALVKAVGYYFSRFELNFSSRGVVDGASYTDVNAQLPALTLLTVIAVIAAGLFIWNIFRRGWVLPIIAVGLWALISLVVGTLYPAFVQSFRVNPDELAKERKYIRRNISATRAAFNLDAENISVEQFDYTNNLTLADLQENSVTIGNARLWDPTQLLANIRSFQQLATFYQFGDADVDRYEIDGATRQVLVSARELDRENLPSQTWVSRNLEYTHGYGLTVSPSNDAVRGGQPAYLLDDIPPQNEAPVLDLDRPEIYYSENLGGFSLVDAKQDEFNFPREGRDNATNRYEGTGGVKMSSLLRRGAFALRFTDYNILISDQITDQTKVLYLRDIRQRVKKAAPFLNYDDDPYPVILDGRVTWVLDGYTTTSRYPYSESTSGGGAGSGFNYIRNPVKVAIDAYDGSIIMYVIDEDDPIIRAYRKAFPQLFTDGDDMPEGLRAHLRYPEDLFTVQTDVYAAYHMTDPNTFFNKSDLWAVSPDPGSGAVGVSEAGVLATTSTSSPEAARSTSARMEPIYLQIRLPGEEQEEFLILRPYVPVSRDNALTQLSSFMVAKSDPGSYGELTSFVMPAGRSVFGPSQVDSQINTTQEISEQFTLLGRTGSTVIQGSMQLIPVEDSILYIRPIYVQAQSGSQLPSYRFVIVFYNETAKLGSTLRGALDQFPEFAGIAPRDEVTEAPNAPADDTPTEETPGEAKTVQELVTEANAKFTEAQTALDDNELGRYQELIEEVGALLAEAQGATSGSDSSTATTTTTAPNPQEQAAARP